MVVSLRFNFRPFRLWAADASNSLTTKSHLRPAGTLKDQGRYANRLIALGSLHLIGGPAD